MTKGKILKTEEERDRWPKIRSSCYKFLKVNCYLYSREQQTYLCTCTCTCTCTCMCVCIQLCTVVQTSDIFVQLMWKHARMLITNSWNQPHEILHVNMCSSLFIHWTCFCVQLPWHYNPLKDHSYPICILCEGVNWYLSNSTQIHIIYMYIHTNIHIIN